MTTQSLREKAAASWGDTTAADASATVRTVITDPPAPNAAGDAVPLVPFAELRTETTDDPPQVSVHVAWARVMREVEGIGKHSLYNGGGTRYNFRGVDATVNAFGPACRRHGVMVIPTGVRSHHADARTSKGNATRETTAIVSWRIYGPMGDWIDGESEGESLDSSDKGTAKAQSVALRVFLLAAGLVPTDEKDPDASHIERGERPMPKAADYVDEICDPRTSLSRIRQVWSEVKRHNLLTASVTNEHGEAETLDALLRRKGEERSADAGPEGGES